MMEGWIKLHRQIVDHWIFDNDAYLRAWIIILMKVNHEPAKCLIHGELIECSRGQSILSLASWAKLFGRKWSIQKVRTLFSLLEKDKMITIEGLTKTTRLTVCKYDSYQDVQQTNNRQKTSRQQTSNRHPTDIQQQYKNDKNDKNDKELFMSTSVDQKIDTSNLLTQRIEEFCEEVISVGSSIYTEQMLTRFIKYWTEPTRAKKPKLKFEKESTWDTAGRLAYWARTNYDKIPCYLAEEVPISTKKAQFIEKLAEYQEKYPKEMLNEFYRHWMQPENKSNPKMLRWELEEFWDLGTRLKSWSERKNGFEKPKEEKISYMPPAKY